MRPFLSALTKGVRSVRPARLLVVLAISLLAGLACDWFRADQRLVFPRPLPEFKTTPPPR
jgi:hypothetical protein